MTRRAVLGWVPWVALAAAVLVVQLGWRAPVADGVTLPSIPGTGAWMDALRDAPYAAIPDPGAASLVSGIVLGRTDGIDPTVQASFLDSGLWHLLAASGTNVGLAAMLCMTVARIVRAPRAVGVAAGCVGVVMYVFAVGSGASIVRAGLLAVALMCAWLVGVSADARRVLVGAAALICWLWPGSYAGLGMQLSFACVIVLMWRFSAWHEAVVRRGVWSWLAGTLVATVLCGLAAAPILALRTGSAPVVGSVANVIAVPLASVVLIMGLPGALAWAVGAQPVGAALLTVAGWVAVVLRHVAERAAAMPLAQVDQVPVLVAVPLCVAAAAAIGDRVRDTVLRRRARRAVWALAAACVCWSIAGAVAPRVGVVLPGGPVRALPRPPGDLWMVSLDVGQGDATLLQTDAGAVLVDVGPPDGRVVERVRQMGVQHVDGVVLTHDSLDHRGGYDAVMAALDPAWVAKPLHAPGPWKRILDMTPPKLIELCAGSQLSLGRDVRIYVRNPVCDGHVVQRTSDIHNDGAVILEIHHRGVTLIDPADAEAPVIRRLELPHVDVLRVSHHGSSDPDLPALLAQVRPELASISVGAHNDYGHPRADTLHALDAADVRTYRTDRDGSVVFDSDGERVSVQLVPRR